MCWLVQRTSPHEPVSFWGRSQMWLPRRRAQHPSELLQLRVPQGAARFESYDAAFDIAEHLRGQPLAHGEVIAVVPGPEERR